MVDVVLGRDLSSNNPSVFLLSAPPSIWDDPCRAVADVPPVFDHSEPDLNVIRLNQAGFLPYIGELQKPAARIAAAADAVTKMVRSREVLAVIRYRNPRAPREAWPFIFPITDVPVFLKTERDRPSPIFDSLFPPRELGPRQLESVLHEFDSGFLPKQPRVKVLSEQQLAALQPGSFDFREAGIIEQEMRTGKERAYGRVVWPGLLTFVERWIRVIEGPLWDVSVMVVPKPVRENVQKRVHHGTNWPTEALN